MLSDFVHERETWRGNWRREVRKVCDYFPLRPTLTGVLGSEESANDTTGLCRAKIGAATRMRHIQFLSGSLNEQNPRDFKPAIACQVIPAPTVGLAKVR